MELTPTPPLCLYGVNSGKFTFICLIYKTIQKKKSIFGEVTVSAIFRKMFVYVSSLVFPPYRGEEV